MQALDYRKWYRIEQSIVLNSLALFMLVNIQHRKYTEKKKAIVKKLTYEWINIINP